MFKFISGTIFGLASAVGILSLIGLGVYIEQETQKTNQKNEDRTIDI
jgi:hypothetical protein